MEDDNQPSKHLSWKEFKLQRYKGAIATVGFDKKVCVHAGKCVKQLPAVFDVKKDPWINPDGAEIDALRKTIAACPSGALSIEED